MYLFCQIFIDWNSYLTQQLGCLVSIFLYIFFSHRTLRGAYYCNKIVVRKIRKNLCKWDTMTYFKTLSPLYNVQKSHNHNRNARCRASLSRCCQFKRESRLQDFILRVVLSWFWDVFLIVFIKINEFIPALVILIEFYCNYQGFDKITLFIHFCSSLDNEQNYLVLYSKNYRIVQSRSREKWNLWKVIGF